MSYPLCGRHCIHQSTKQLIDWRNRLPRSERAYEHIRALAERHPNTKFVSIIGDKCIPNLPESRVPMIIVYRKGEVVTQILSWGADKERSLDGTRLLTLSL